jgi:hypothetical protein
MYVSVRIKFTPIGVWNKEKFNSLFNFRLLWWYRRIVENDYVVFTRNIWTWLTLILLTWRKWWAPNNASRWQMEFNSAFKGLIRSTHTHTHTQNPGLKILCSNIYVRINKLQVFSKFYVVWLWTLLRLASGRPQWNTTTFLCNYF